MIEPLPGICGKRFLTTYLTITGFGAHGDSGDKSSKEQLFWNKRCQKGAEIVRRKFHQIFGIKRPWVRIPQSGPTEQGRVKALPFSFNMSIQVLLLRQKTKFCPIDVVGAIMARPFSAMLSEGFGRSMTALYRACAKETKDLFVFHLPNTLKYSHKKIIVGYERNPRVKL